MALLAFVLRLYLDFWGYSLMAMGLGRIIGFELPKNFDDPYTARSVSEFYRRWHASLGAWFRNYIYIPLGGNRKGTFRTLLNLAVVWLLTGLWHGIGPGYLLWAGILLFFGVMVTHDYTMGKNFLTLIATVLSMCVILFAVILFSNLVTKMVMFVSSIVTEITFRM